jgi:hypothetical protein
MTNAQVNWGMEQFNGILLVAEQMRGGLRVREVDEMRPVAPVIGDTPENADVFAERRDLGEVVAIVPDKGGYRLDAFQPHIVEHNQTAGLAELLGEVEIDKDVVEPVVAIDEDEAERASHPLEINQGTV